MYGCEKFGVFVIKRVAVVAVDRSDSTALRDWAFDVGDRRSSLRTYQAVRLMSRTFLVPYLSVQAENTEVLDRSGPMILAPVHRSHLDSVLVATVCRRRLRALGKESLFATPGVGWMCAALGAIPVRRGAADKEALKAAKALLDRGESMFVFPEGGRFEGADPSERNTVQTLFDGAAWLASRTGASVVPIGIAGTAEALGPGQKFIRRAKVGISVGEPLAAPTGDNGRAKRQQLSEFTSRLRVALQERQNRAADLVGGHR